MQIQASQQNSRSTIWYSPLANKANKPTNQPATNKQTTEIQEIKQ